jgi:serine/threonine protein kinase
MSITSTAGFMDALREYHILEPEQFEKVNRAVQGRTPEPRALAQELLKRGWMTAYQANQLLQGRGAELILGPYLLLERLGEGGMGEVFKARHQLMNRTVAIKVIRKERLSHPQAVERFHREIRMAAQLDHPHLVRAHDAAQVGDTHFLVMEYAEGVDLHRLVQKSGPLPIGQACLYIRQAALGLQHAHERGLVHRDIKPSNLQVTAEGRTVKVLDMGLARSQAPDSSEGMRPELTQACSIMGTPDFIAPEQIVDPRKVDVRADIYSLGCTFYFMLAGRPPFPDGAWEEKLVAHRKSEPKPIEQLRADVPAGVGAILRKMMAKRPEDRYSAPAAVADALTSFAGMSGAVPVPSSSPVGQPGSNQPGWTVAANSTIDPPSGQTMQTPTGMPPPGPTVLIAAQQTGSMPPTANGRKRLGLVLGGALVAVAGLLIALLIVLWTKGGDKDKKGDGQRADNTKNTSTDSNDKDTSTAPPSDLPRVLVDEDFSTPYKNKLTIPENWGEGEAYRVIKLKDADHKHALEVTRPTGVHFAKLPPLNLSGDFYIEGIYSLGYSHKFTVSLENRSRSALLPIVFDVAGGVLIENDARLPPPGYIQNKPTHFLVKREGKKLRVFLDKDPVADKVLEELDTYDAIRLSMTAGNWGGLQARLYGIRVGTPGGGGQVPPSMTVPDKDSGRRRGKK